MIPHQSIYSLVQICAKKGLHQVVLCPGSRCAPLTIAFARHPGFTVYTLSDERSAGFVALGIAQETKKPAVLVCTSGTAVYNFAPAIAEAYFSNTPLLVITADRPEEWIGQQDGQTIFQFGIFGQHVKKSFTLPVDLSHVDSRWVLNRNVNEAINLAEEAPCGPVHINAPFREPLYPTADAVVTFDDHVRIIDNHVVHSNPRTSVGKEVRSDLRSFQHVMIVCGQTDYDQHLRNQLQGVSLLYSIPVIAEITSNLQGIEHITSADLILGQANTSTLEGLEPDLVITLGHGIVSRNIKTFLRSSSTTHWHIQQAGPVADTYKHLTRIIRMSPVQFFDLLNTKDEDALMISESQVEYFRRWMDEEERLRSAIKSYFENESAGEFGLVQRVLQTLPENSTLHLANSMSIRYANALAFLLAKENSRVFSNRGTSGIDGCTSTAVGHALLNDQLNVLLTGDQAFFYDRNAFWHNYGLPNLRIVLLNNHGGVIFRLIDGPSNLPERDPYFVGEQRLTALKLCEEFGFQHIRYNPPNATSLLTEFFSAEPTVKVLEIESDPETAQDVYLNFKKHIRTLYES